MLLTVICSVVWPMDAGVNSTLMEHELPTVSVWFAPQVELPRMLNALFDVADEKNGFPRVRFKFPMLYSVAVRGSLWVPWVTPPNASVERLPFTNTRLLSLPAPILAMTKLWPPAEIAIALAAESKVFLKFNRYGGALE